MLLSCQIMTSRQYLNKDYLIKDILFYKHLILCWLEKNKFKFSNIEVLLKPKFYVKMDLNFLFLSNIVIYLLTI